MNRLIFIVLFMLFVGGEILFSHQAQASEGVSKSTRQFCLQVYKHTRYAQGICHRRYKTAYSRSQYWGRKLKRSQQVAEFCKFVYRKRSQNYCLRRYKSVDEIYARANGRKANLWKSKYKKTAKKNGSQKEIKALNPPAKERNGKQSREQKQESPSKGVVGSQKEVKQPKESLKPPKNIKEKKVSINKERKEAKKFHKKNNKEPRKSSASQDTKECGGLANKSAFKKYNQCRRKMGMPEIELGKSGNGFLIDGSKKHGVRKVMYAIKNGKCVYSHKVSLGKGSERGINSYANGSKKTPAGLFGLSENKRDSRFRNKSLIFYSGNSSARGIYAHNGNNGKTSGGCIRLGGPFFSHGGNYGKMLSLYRKGVNNAFIFFERPQRHKYSNDGCGSPQRINGKSRSKRKNKRSSK